jgi:hypothetical protein
MAIRDGTYHDGPKGYLTYPIKKGDSNSAGIMGVLLKEKRDIRYIVDFGDNKINEKRVSAPLAKYLKSMGIKVKVVDHITTKGINKINVSINNMIKTIPIQVHKIFSNKELIEIQIRVTAATEGELVLNMYAIQNVLDKWQIKPKECLWTSGGWTEASTKPLVAEHLISKEDQRLKEIIKKHESDIADIKDTVNDLRKTPLKNAVLAERKVRADVLR